MENRILYQKPVFFILPLLLFYLFCSDKTNITNPDKNSTGTLYFSTIGPNRIWKIEDNGKDLFEITEGVEFDISPDGQKIVLAGQGDTGIDIFVMDINGSNKINLTSELKFSSSDPKWSPDGAKIAFQAGISGSMNDTWIMKADGSDKIKMTAGDSFLVHYAPEWSRDGSMLSFIKGIGEKDNDIWSWIDELWIISLTGESQKLLNFERPNSSAIWNRYNDAIAFISGGILFSLKDQAKTQISDWYTSDFEWKDDKSLVYVQVTDQVQNIYESEIGAEPTGLTIFKESKGITKICILDDSRIAYNTDKMQIFIHSKEGEQLICEMGEVEVISHISWLPHK